MNPSTRRLAGALLLALPAAPLVAQSAAPAITLERIFASSDFRVRTLPEAGWMADGERYTYVQPNAAAGTTDLVVEQARTGERRVLVDGARLVPPGADRPIRIEGYQWSADESKLLVYTNSQPVWRQNTKGTYYVYDLARERLTPVSSRAGWQQFAKFSPDGARVGFVRDHDLFVTDLETLVETRLTHDGSATIINGTFDWVYEEELGLHDGWRWSRDGRRIAFWQLDQSAIRPFYMMDDREVYSRPVPLPYPKAGEPNSSVRIGAVELASGAISWIDTGEEQDIYLARMEWAASPHELVIQRMNRHQNRIDVLLADARTGASRLLFSETDDAWVDVHDELTWIRGGRQLVWPSERDGYRHLYLYERNGRVVRQLTRGAWEVTALNGVDERGGWVYFTANEQGPTQKHLYRVRLDGRGLERLSRAPGTHTMRPSPRFGYYIGVHSRAGVPPTTRLHTARGDVVRTLVDNDPVAERLAAAGAVGPEFFTFTTRDGVQLNGWMIKPAGFDPARRYPALVYVYGGPGTQTVTDAWGGNRYLWHQHLAQKGYLVVSVDNRGTAGRGRDFTKQTYLNLGKWETHDQIETGRHLAGLPFVDAARIGIWGWSHGGFMTLLALTQGADVFSAGVSVAPVTDWRLYDTILTERFMRTPAENDAGYRASAPLTYADRLTGRLLLVHGTADDNVHFQQSVQMVDALQRAGKQFDFMMYPNRNHAISGGTTQLHLYTLITRWLERNL